MKPINIRDAKTQLSRLVERAAAGEEIIVAKAGRPMVRLVPFHDARTERRFGALKGKIRVSPDFDAALPKNVLRAFGLG